jgi:hypothetical protein
MGESYSIGSFSRLREHEHMGSIAIAHRAYLQGALCQVERQGPELLPEGPFCRTNGARTLENGTGNAARTPSASGPKRIRNFGTARGQLVLVRIVVLVLAVKVVEQDRRLRGQVLEGVPYSRRYYQYARAQVA